MIYVEEKNFVRQVDLLSFLARSMSLNICAWLYPESEATELAGFDVIDNHLSLTPVTTYSDGFSPRCTLLVPASNDNLDSFRSSYSELKRSCDSLALYKSNESSWFVATIGHEGMCLVQDDSFLIELTEAGYAATNQAPSWW